MDSTEWIDMTYWSSIMTPQPAVVVTVPTNTTTSGNSTYDGTTPPAGALIVSKSAIEGTVTYSTIQDALNAAPVTSKANATIFIYPGIYDEQLIITKPGHTIFQGYSSATGDYSQNQVTIQFNHGIDTQGTSGSDTDGATVYATGNYFHAFNINFRNNNGTQKNIASLGFAVKSSKFASLYSCQIYGNQDTLDISGYLFTFKTYIEGNVDFIFGSGSGYFLDSTISPNQDGISITADKRTTNSSGGGLVFDQCTIKAAPGTGPFTNIGLGRPWNSNARVAYVGCYLDSFITASGWNPWSKSTPNTNGVLFGEYRNYGPGSSNCNRATYSQQLSDTDVVQFQLGNLFMSTAFIDFNRIDVQPFSIGVGQAQSCSTQTSSLVPSSTSSLPVITAYTTTTITAGMTVTTSVTASDVTSTTVLKLSLTSTVTGIDSTRTSIEKTTTTVSSTSADATSTATSIVTEDDGLTITPDPTTKTNVVKATTTTTSTKTIAATTSIIKGTTTTTVPYTSFPKPTTVTISEGSTVYITSSKVPKAVSTTVKTTISIVPTSTKTSTVKPKSSVTVSTVSYKTVTKKSIITQSCIPTAPAHRFARRRAIIPRVNVAASTTTLTLTSTATATVKTSTITQPGNTIIVTATSTAPVKIITVKGTTTTVTATSVAKTVTVEQPGSTHYTTVTSTSTVGKTTTLKPSTITVDSTNFVTKSIAETTAPEAATITSLKTVTKSQTITAQQQTVLITRSSDVTSTVKTTVPASTSTVYQTVKEGSGVAISTVTAAPGTKTVVQKLSTTVFSYATTTSKGAKQCTS